MPPSAPLSFRRVTALLLLLGTAALPITAARADDKDARQGKKSAEKNAAPETPAPPAKPRPRLRIAVDQWKWNETRSEWYDLPRDVREGMQAALLEKLNKCGYFQAMEREATALAQGNQERQFDQEKRRSVEEAQQNNGSDAPRVTPRLRETVTPAQYIITPTVTGLQRTSAGKSGFNFGPFRKGSGKMTVTLTISLRISDAETSDLIATETAEGKQETREDGFKVDLGGLGYNKDDSKQTSFSKVTESALADAVDKIILKIGSKPFTALVAATDTRTGRVILAAGEQAGLAPGMEFDVMRPGGEVRNPETGEIITKGDEVKIGRIRVVKVQEKAAFCEIIEGKGFDSKDIARFVL